MINVELATSGKLEKSKENLNHCLSVINSHFAHTIDFSRLKINNKVSGKLRVLEISQK